MKKHLNLVSLCLLMMLALSVSIFAKSSVSQPEKSTNINEKASKRFEIIKPQLLKRFPRQSEFLKSRCEEGGPSAECVQAIVKIIIDVATGAGCSELITDILNLIDKCKDLLSRNIDEKSLSKELLAYLESNNRTLILNKA